MIFRQVFRIQLNALFVLRDACENTSFANEIFRLGGVLTLVDSLIVDRLGIGEACSILLRLLVFRRARKVIRRSGSISKLVIKQIFLLSINRGVILSSM